MNYLGIDFGQKKVGLAIGDDVIKIASPHMLLKRMDDEVLFAEIQAEILNHEIGKVIVGIPENDKETSWYQEVQTFVSSLTNYLEIPVETIDERYSTQLSDSLQKELPKKHRRDDEVAASLILQSYFDKQ